MHTLIANYAYKFRFLNQCYTGLSLKQQCAHRTNLRIYLHRSPFQQHFGCLYHMYVRRRICITSDHIDK